MDKRCKSEVDMISTLPESLLETILCLLPTKMAARTSILSRQWRYKWTNLSKLAFRVPLVYTPITNRRKPFNDLRQLLLSHQGVINDFSLSMNLCNISDHDHFVFDQTILLLSKNHTLKKLKIHGINATCQHNLPKSVVLLDHLTDLYVEDFAFDIDLLNGFGNLTTLTLENVRISTKSLLRLLSNCPLLKCFTLAIGRSHLDGKDCSVIELFKCLPMIEHLTLFGYYFKWLVVDVFPQELPTLLFHLKYFFFEELWFPGGHGLAFLLVLIKCSPNLEKIKLKIDRHLKRYDEKCSVVWQRFSDVRLEHLNELEIRGFSNLENEMEFLKFILARSPKLKKVSMYIVTNRRHGPEMLKTISQAPRASPVAVVTYSCYGWKSFKVL